MSDRYLWDRSGPPDPEVERLEKLLAPLGHQARPAAAPAVRPWRALAAAAAVTVAAAGLWQFQLRPAEAPATGWQVAHAEGAAQVGGRSAEVSMELRAGEVMRTAQDGELMLEDQAVGRLDLGPDSVLRAANDKRLKLEQGHLHAFIWARPGKFVVDTPSSRAVDLGCEYTLDVNGAGDGLLKVSMGWVAFRFGGRDSFIPAGARCVTRKRTGPGIPYFNDAPPELAESVAAFEKGDREALGRVLAAARPGRDGLTLWHLLTRVAPQDRAAVYDRFTQVVDVPQHVSREGVLKNDPDMIDRCWDALELENTGWWRGWERNWSER